MILPPAPVEGRGWGRRFFQCLPDLALGLTFMAAWLDLFGLGGRYGVNRMLLVEIEAWILGVSLLTAALAYSLATDEQWTERAKSFFRLIFFCTLPPLYFALLWHLWWPIGVYAGLLWNRLRLARAGAEGVRRMRMPLRELVHYFAAIIASMWLALPALGAGEIQFRIGDYPGWCQTSEALLPEEIRTEPGVVTWCTAPYRALAAGALYYGLTGLVTLLRGPYQLSLWWGWVRRDPED